MSMYQQILASAAKHVPALAAAAIATASLAGTAHAAEEQLWSSVKKAGVLRCGAAVAPPYVMRDPKTGSYTGFFTDLCRDFGQNVLKVKVQFVDTTWDSSIAGLQAGKWDMSMAMNNTPERARAVSFSSGVTDYEVSFIYNKANPKLAGRPTGLGDIDKPGMTLAVMSGTAQDKLLSAAVKKAQVMRLPGADETRLALTSKRADVLVDASDTNWLFAEANKDWAVAFTPDPPLAKQAISFALRKDTAPADIAELNAYIKRNLEAGTVNSLIDKAVRETLSSSK